MKITQFKDKSLGPHASGLKIMDMLCVGYDEYEPDEDEYEYEDEQDAKMKQYAEMEQYAEMDQDEDEDIEDYEEEE